MKQRRIVSNSLGLLTAAVTTILPASALGGPQTSVAVPTTDVSSPTAYPLGPGPTVPFLEVDPATQGALGIRLPDGRRLSWGRQQSSIFGVQRARGGFLVTGSFGAHRYWNRLVRTDGTRRTVTTYRDCTSLHPDDFIPLVTEDGRDAVVTCHGVHSNLMRLVRLSDSRILAHVLVSPRTVPRGATPARVVLSDGRVWHPGSGAVSVFRRSAIDAADVTAGEVLTDRFTVVRAFPAGTRRWTTRAGKTVTGGWPPDGRHLFANDVTNGGPLTVADSRTGAAVRRFSDPGHFVVADWETSSTFLVRTVRDGVVSQPLRCGLAGRCHRLRHPRRIGELVPALPH